MDIKDTQTTTKSNTLKAERKNAPSWSINPYDIIFKNNSIVKIVVKI